MSRLPSRLNRLERAGLNGHACPLCSGPAHVVLVWPDGSPLDADRPPGTDPGPCPLCGRRQLTRITLRWPDDPPIGFGGIL
jgi:hypothetical protein